ncbi:Threonine synthase protein [Halorhabdus tiamatea SARL4B]|uniref:Threonine synthase n=1 Tax=Halorhabdus tiamatea SARL4B TaxID=1033806 RepID=F7PII6_9EURY|nr:pyridoxal-phosphate dependent enzyme [Halorhabdus tiamatea]ERJ07040.1 Threonine synthase protein [Halorhabdus tiamatea SARL4B]CCQ34807.1 threonine synthase [Halorhabdus tiamatea SARL4B]
MHTDGALAGFDCPTCGRTHAPDDVETTCPDCGDPVTPAFDPGALAKALDARTHDATGIDRFAPAIGFDSDSRVVSLGAGGRTVVDAPSLASELGVESVRIADEGRNPTGSAVDRELAVAVSVAAERDAERVVLPSTGNAARSAAAYAGRAGLESLAYVPSRTAFLEKAMTNVHGGDLSVVEGRYADAAAAYDSADTEGFQIGPDSPFRQLGAATLAWDLFGKQPNSPDAVVVPVGHGTRLAGFFAGLSALKEMERLDSLPELYAAQPKGCAPIVTAHEAEGEIEPWDTPDSVIGPLEIPDPAVGSLALDALAASDGDAVAVPDDDALAAAVDANATTGVEVSATGGVALAGATTLAEQGALGSDVSVLVVDPLAAAAESDILRSQLMSRGI